MWKNGEGTLADVFINGESSIADEDDVISV